MIMMIIIIMLLIIIMMMLTRMLIIMILLMILNLIYIAQIDINGILSAVHSHTAHTHTHTHARARARTLHAHMCTYIREEWRKLVVKSTVVPNGQPDYGIDKIRRSENS